MTKDIQDRARDIQDRVGQFLGSDSGRQLVGTAVSELLRGLVTRKPIGGDRSRSSEALSGARGVAVGAGAAAIAPVAVRGVGKLFSRNGVGSIVAGPRKLVEDTASKVGEGIGRAPGRKRTSQSSGKRKTAQKRRGASSGQTRARTSRAASRGSSRAASRGSAGSSSSQRRSSSASGSSQRRSTSASGSSRRRSAGASSSNGSKTSARSRSKTSRSSSNSSAAHQGRQRSRSSRSS